MDVSCPIIYRCYGRYRSRNDLPVIFTISNRTKLIIDCRTSPFRARYKSSSPAAIKRSLHNQTTLFNFFFFLFTFIFTFFWSRYMFYYFGRKMAISCGGWLSRRLFLLIACYLVSATPRGRGKQANWIILVLWSHKDPLASLTLFQWTSSWPVIIK